MYPLSDRIFCITLGALLHDIGKPLQRACKSDKNTLGKDAKSMNRADLVGYQHSLWTADFLFRWQDKLTQLTAVREYRFENFQKLASKHHNPENDNIDELIIQAADWASAGADRHHEDDAPDNQFGKECYIRKPLTSLFTRINLDGHFAQPKFHNLGQLDSDSIFPAETNQLSSEQYARLMADFETHFARLPFTQPDLFLDALTSLITRFFWCVPSSTVDGFADIPLSDHCITTAAIAAATAASRVETPAAVRKTEYLLVSGDFAGIQKFIFTLTGESNMRIAKLLRGRSFMVNMYNVLAARMVTDACGLPALNVLSAAGGKFQLLLPAGTLAQEALTNVRRSIQQWVYETYFGELKLAIDEGVLFTYDDFRIDKFQQVLARAADSLNREKLRPFCSQLTGVRDWVDDTRFSEFQKHGKCKICGVEPAKESGEPGENCQNFINIGQKLPKGNAIAVYNDCKEGIFNRFRLSIVQDDPIDVSNTCACFLINLHKKDPAALPTQTLQELHYSNYTPTAEPHDDGNAENGDLLGNATFEAIVNEGKGLPALAVLKADLDNMGYVFMTGFKDVNGISTLSLSRMVSLSRMINWFFAGYLPRFIMQKQEAYHNIYTLFAGGDDLCLIGQWNTMIDFAEKIQAEFSRYTGNTAAFTISAGIELFKQKYPVAKAVAAAETMLELSKHNPGKNSITLFGYTMKWGDEFRSQLNFAENWEKFINETNEDAAGNRNAMLYRFLLYHQEWENAKKNNETLTRLKHRFRFIYDINRNLKPKKSDQIDWRKKKPFVDLLATNNPGMDETPDFKFLAVGLTIALYLSRKVK